MKSQCDRLATYLKSRSITPMQALTDLGIYRLAARINDLRDRGLDIQTEMVEVENMYGETCRVARYSM